MFRVDFDGTGRAGFVAPGSTIFDAARRAGVHINTMCGGKGGCGRCRVVVLEGSVNMRPNSFLDEREIREGYVLACLTEVLSDIRVEIPPESRVNGEPVLGEKRAEEFDVYGEYPGRRPRAPLCRKTYLELPKPGMDDNSPDLERVKRELERVEGVSGVKVDLAAVRSLPSVLRESDFGVTVTSAYSEGDFRLTRFEGGDTTGVNYGIACDVGTTTVVADLVELRDGRVCATAACYNSQMRHGEDVISRIDYSRECEDGLRELGRLIAGDINGLIGELAGRAGIRRSDIGYMVCTGNTVMIHLLLGIDPGNIRREPYIPVVGTPPAVRAKEIGVALGEAGYVGFLPGFGAYVGSDVTAAVLASGMWREEGVGLLMDVGTNGEMVLGCRDWLICCSASAGPAFEGAGTSCGVRAAPGAIEKVRVSSDGTVETRTIGGKEHRPIGLCGSGFIDVVAELFAAGFLDRTGRFKRDVRRPRLREGENGPEFVLVRKEKSGTGKDITVTEDDIAALIRTKGAIYTAAEAIITHVGLTWSDVGRIFVSGGFGNVLDVSRSIVIGLLPDMDFEKFRFMGNGSITGGRMCLLSVDALGDAEEIAGKMTYFDLSTDPWFMREYTSSLFLPHTDLERFPTVGPVDMD